MTDKFKVLTEKEHVLLRPEIMLGTIENIKVNKNILNEETDEYELKEFEFCEGFFRLFEEAITNSVDEYERNKTLKNIWINIYPEDGCIEINDDGFGYPIKEYVFDSSKKWIPEWILTKLYSGSNFNDVDRKTIGLNGVGISLVNFLSTKFIIKTKNMDSKEYNQILEDNSNIIYEPVFKKGYTGHSYTNIKFYPDFEKFGLTNCLEYYVPLFKEYVRSLIMIYPQIKFTFNGKRLYFEKKTFFSAVLNDHIIEKYKDFDLAIGFSKENQKDIIYINSKPVSIYNEYEIYKTRLFTSIRNILNKKYNLNVSRNTWFYENISTAMILKGTNVKFKNQTKDILVSYKSVSDLNFNTISDDSINETAKLYSKNENLVKRYLEYFNIKDIENSELKIKKIKNEFVPKLIEAIGKPEEKILCICEGDSAVGGFSAVRDKMVHSFLPLRGKPKNVNGYKLSDILKNQEYNSIVSAIHLGHPDELRHSKCYIIGDADEDGAHIRILLIQFFLRFFPWFIEQGRLFIVEPPKYKFNLNNKVEYTNNEPPKEAKNIKYYKGLGSMDRDATKESLHNPKLIKIENVKELLKVYKEIYPD